MLINGFWIDETVQRLIGDLQELNQEKAVHFEIALQVLYPNHRQLGTEEDFREFVQAVIDYEELVEN